jgi:acetyl esterase/lipase
MKFFWSALGILIPLGFLGPAFGQEKPQDNIKVFTYKKTKQAELAIHVHFPPDWKKEDKRPAIVFFFGGGFRTGSIGAFSPQATYFASRGMVAARADYRVKDRHGVEPDACVEDGKSAVRWLRQNAAMLGLDPDRIVASGGSAGGYLAAAAACPGLDAEGEDPKVSSRPNVLILFNPFLPFRNQTANWKIVPTLHVTKNTPPTLILFGTKDNLLKPAEEFMARSKEVGHRTEMYLAEGAGHGFFNGTPWREKTLQRADEFLASLGYLKGKPTIQVGAAGAGSPPRPQPRPPLPPPTYRDVRYGPHQRNVLDFWQARSDQPTPLLVSIHGGGFVAGDKSVGPPLLKECLEAGISVAAISYRYSTQAIAPAPFQDGARAVQFLRSKARDWNIDPKRVAATGGSAGAGISLWLGFHDDMADPKSDDPVLRQSTRLTCMAVFNGQTSYDPRFIRKLFPGKDVYKIDALRKLFGVDLNKLDDLPAEKYQLFEEVSAINHLTRDDPPVLLSYSSPMDAEITDMGIGIHHPLFGKVLKEKMDELQISCELYAANQRIGGGTPMRTIDFLKKHLGLVR